MHVASVWGDVMGRGPALVDHECRRLFPEIQSVMTNWLRQLDELLRGERVRGDLLAQGRIDLRLRLFVPIAVILGAIYGFFMGWYALTGKGSDAYLHLFSTTIKLPLLFLLTLAVTFPSLYVFNALVGCRMTFASTLRVLVGAIVVNLAVAASLGPILAFFTLSTTSYAFMVLLNISLLGVAGMVSLGFLLRALRSLARSRAYADAAQELASLHPSSAEAETPAPSAPPAASTFEDLVRSTEHASAEPPRMTAQQRARDLAHLAAARDTQALVARREGAANLILAIWVFIYALVGAQMGWILRPFIGSPNLPFEWFRAREGSFFNGAIGALRQLFGG